MYIIKICILQTCLKFCRLGITFESLSPKPLGEDFEVQSGLDLWGDPDDDESRSLKLGIVLEATVVGGDRLRTCKNSVVGEIYILNVSLISKQLNNHNVWLKHNPLFVLD